MATDEIRETERKIDTFWKRVHANLDLNAIGNGVGKGVAQIPGELFSRTFFLLSAPK